MSMTKQVSDRGPGGTEQGEHENFPPTVFGYIYLSFENVNQMANKDSPSISALSKSC